jgi:hypothetical protein
MKAISITDETSAEQRQTDEDILTCDMSDDALELPRARRVDRPSSRLAGRPRRAAVPAGWIDPFLNAGRH